MVWMPTRQGEIFEATAFEKRTDLDFLCVVTTRRIVSHPTCTLPRNHSAVIRWPVGVTASLGAEVREVSMGKRSFRRIPEQLLHQVRSMDGAPLAVATVLEVPIGDSLPNLPGLELKDWS